MPPASCASGIRSRPPMVKPKPVTVEVVQTGHRPRADHGDRGEARRGEHGHARAGQDRGLAEPGRQAHEQPEAGHGQAGGEDGEPAARPPGHPLRGEHQDRGGPDRDQRGQRYRGQRHGGEVAALVERGQQPDHGDPGPGRPARRPGPAGRGEIAHDQHAPGSEPERGDGDRGQAGHPAEQAAGQPACPPQQSGYDEVEQASRGPGGDCTHRGIAPATRRKWSRKRGAPNSPRRPAHDGARRGTRNASAQPECCASHDRQP